MPSAGCVCTTRYIAMFIIDVNRVSALPENDVLNYHIEHIEASAAARALVSRYDSSDSHPTEPPPDAPASANVHFTYLIGISEKRCQKVGISRIWGQ